MTQLKMITPTLLWDVPAVKETTCVLGSQA